MPSKKKYNSRFPPARIKKIMQVDEEVGKVAAPVPVMISRVLERFVQHLLDRSSTIALTNKAKTLQSLHLTQAILAEPRFHFLLETIRQHCKNSSDADMKGPLSDTINAACNALNMAKLPMQPPAREDSPTMAAAVLNNVSSLGGLASVPPPPPPPGPAVGVSVTTPCLPPASLDSQHHAFSPSGSSDLPQQATNPRGSPGRGRGRPRGRPPKRPLPDLTPLTSTSLTTPPKRGRGRPRKVQVAPVFVDDLDQKLSPPTRVEVLTTPRYQLSVPRLPVPPLVTPQYQIMRQPVPLLPGQQEHVNAEGSPSPDDSTSVFKSLTPGDLAHPPAAQEQTDTKEDNSSLRNLPLIPGLFKTAPLMIPVGQKVPAPSLSALHPGGLSDSKDNPSLQNAINVTNGLISTDGNGAATAVQTRNPFLPGGIRIEIPALPTPPSPHTLIPTFSRSLSHSGYPSFSSSSLATQKCSTVNDEKIIPKSASVIEGMSGGGPLSGFQILYGSPVSTQPIASHFSSVSTSPTCSSNSVNLITSSKVENVLCNDASAENSDEDYDA